jgi:hypothetical protein
MEMRGQFKASTDLLLWIKPPISFEVAGRKSDPSWNLQKQ